MKSFQWTFAHTKKQIKFKNLLCSFAIAGLLASSGCSTEKNLEGQAKISKSEAERIALEKAPGGTIKEGELEKEHGKLIWSFDISKPGTKDITEVQVDAISGAVVSVQDESAEDEAKENSGEKKKHEKEDDDEKEKK
ncbi:MAG: PepSY domain-containing protein [Verrucomicrobiota bacterium]